MCVVLTRTLSRTVFCCRLAETGSSNVQSLSLSDSHLAELDGDTLRLFGLGALEALERGWGVQTAAAVTVITFRYISFEAIVPTLPRIRVKFPNLSVRNNKPRPDVTGPCSFNVVLAARWRVRMWLGCGQGVIRVWLGCD